MPPAATDDELEQLADAWDRFLVAVRQARAKRSEREDGLSLSQYEFARPLTRTDGMKVSELAERYGITSATATGILDGLEREGLIERSRAGRDRRTVTITLTDEGRRKVHRKRQRIARQRRKLFDTLAPEERAHTHRLLNHLAQVIDEL